MEAGGRRLGSGSGSGSGSGGVVVKNRRSSSGCSIVRNKKGDAAVDSAPSKRPKLAVEKSSHDDDDDDDVDDDVDDDNDDELLMPPSRTRLGPDTIRLCTGLTTAATRKRERVHHPSHHNVDGMIVDAGLEEMESKRSKLDVFDFNEYDGMDAQMLSTMRSHKKKQQNRHFDNTNNNDNQVALQRTRGGGGRSVGATHASATTTSGSIDQQFETSSSRHKGKNLYLDRASCLHREDSADHTRIKRNRDGNQLPVPLLRDKFNSDASIRVQGKNGVLKVMVNKKNKAGKPLEHSDNHKPVVASMHSLRTEGTSKRNSQIRPEAKPVGKEGLLVRPKKKHLPARKPLSSMDSAGDEQDLDDISPNHGVKNAESRKSSKKIISEDEQTPKHEKQPSTRTKEVKVKRGSGTEKQKLRERIREMLLNAGWTIDYRPRRNRDYLDAVYINPGGTAYWSIIKAYDALQKQLNDDDDHEAKPKGESSSFSPIADDVLSQLTRNTRKKMEKDMKKKQRDEKKRRDDSESDSGKEPHFKRSAGNRHHKNYMDSDSDEEKLSSFMKHGSKSMKTKMTGYAFTSGSSKSQNATHHSRDGTEKSLSGSEPHLHGRKSRKQGRCTLLVRSSNKGTNSESDDFVPYMGKRTVLSWLVDCGVVRLSQKVQYRKRKRVLLEGWIARDGIHCGCCSKILTVSKFEIHAGSKLPQPYQNIYLDSGISLLQCQIDAWNRQDNSEKVSFHSVDIDGDDPNDDTCGICGDGGDLICCDGCPSTFHQSCLDIQMLPPGEWHCPNCTCKFCGIAGVTINKEDDATTDALQYCALCEKKYHNSCTKEMDAIPTNSNLSGPYFCGKGCKELFEHLKKYLGTKHELDAGFTWSLIHRIDEDSEAASRGVSQRVECNSKLAVALNVMDECFLPVIDRRSGISLIHNVLYNSGSNFSRLNYSGFYTAILERGDEIISAASIRFHGTELAEMPFIGTRHTYRHQGMCRRLFAAIELALCSLKVEKLVIPAISELIHTWTTVFGFTHLEESLRQEMRSLNMLVFPGIDMLQKRLVQEGKLKSAGKENGDEVFDKPKMALGLDMVSTALHDPHESDDTSSNPANEINNECSDAPQELNNDVLVLKTMSSKSSSEERLSDDSISDKCLSPSTSSNGVPEMENKTVTSSPVDNLHPSPKCRLSSRNDTSVTGPPVDATDCHENPALGQETACFGPDSTENLVEPVADRNRDSSEHVINPVLDSQLEDNALSSKEVDIKDACDEVLEAGPSVILSEEKITKENNENADISGSVLNHDGESFLPVRSDLNGEIAHVGEKNLHFDTEIASNEIHFDETVLNPPGHCSETDPV